LKANQRKESDVADNYLEFSEVITDLSQSEEDWLDSQLETVCVFGEQEYAEDQVPAGLDPCEADWMGCRAYRDDPDCADYVKQLDMDGPGFEYDFADGDNLPDSWGRHLWIHGGENGYVDGAACLVRKFLKRFRPDQCWSLTYATTCSKPRVGEFSGGAVFVTAEEIHWQNAYGFVEQHRVAFKQNWKRQKRRDANEPGR
jgi:hypothetical protein